MFSMEEGVAIVFAQVHRLSYEDARAEFTHKFRKPAPTRAHIHLLVNKFEHTDSVCDEARISAETVQQVQIASDRSSTPQ